MTCNVPEEVGGGLGGYSKVVDCTRGHLKVIAGLQDPSSKSSHTPRLVERPLLTAM